MTGPFRFVFIIHSEYFDANPFIYCQRVALESALSHLDVKMIRKICLELGKLVNVRPPHQVLKKFSNLANYKNFSSGDCYARAVFIIRLPSR